MSKSMNLNSLEEIEEITSRDAITRYDAAIVVLRPRTAGNDEIHEEPAIATHAFESRTRDTLAADGRGDLATHDGASSARPTSQAMSRAARAQRPPSVGQIIVAAIRAASAVTRQAHLRFRQRAEAATNYDTLRRLDDRTLHDIGFDRSEIGSSAAEVREEVEYANLRALSKPYRLK